MLTKVFFPLLCLSPILLERLSEVIGEAPANSLSTCTKSCPSPLSSPNGKISLASPKRGQKREEGWKEVVRRQAKFYIIANFHFSSCLLWKMYFNLA